MPFISRRFALVFSHHVLGATITRKAPQPLNGFRKGKLDGDTGVSIKVGTLSRSLWASTTRLTVTSLHCLQVLDPAQRTMT
jgi:hypothetical protein